MTDRIDDPKLLALWADALAVEPVSARAPEGALRLSARAPEGALRPPATERARFLASLSAERYLPFCAELARHVDLPEPEVRRLLARSCEPSAWTKAFPPVAGFIDFKPGASVAPLHAGFVRLLGGARLPRHEHIDRELTFVLEGEIRDDQERCYGPGSVIEMPAGSAHALHVAEHANVTLVLLHGRVRSA